MYVVSDQNLADIEGDKNFALQFAIVIANQKLGLNLGFITAPNCQPTTLRSTTFTATASH